MVSSTSTMFDYQFINFKKTRPYLTISKMLSDDQIPNKYDDFICQ